MGCGARPRAGPLARAHRRAYDAIRGDITLHPALLEPDQRGEAVATLVHETFHALSDPHRHEPFPAATADWWYEGAATEAEGSRLMTASEADALLANGWAFDPEWRSHAPQSEAERWRRYQYHGFLVRQYIEQNGLEAYGSVWRELRAGSGATECTCTSLADVLASYAREGATG